jgi:hypothetical protein
MSDTALISAQTSPTKTCRKSCLTARRIALVSLICCVIAGSVLADSVTYQRLQQAQSGGATATAKTPDASRPKERNQQNGQGQDQTASLPASESSSAAKESPNPPEFVRLPDGRIVRYGPGVLCDQNCVTPITPVAFRGPSSRVWWIATPAAAAGVLCAFLCGDDEQQQAQLLIPDPTPVAQPTVSPTTQPTPPPNEIPEPGTLVLLGLGIGAIVARRRMAAKKNQG